MYAKDKEPIFQDQKSNIDTKFDMFVEEPIVSKDYKVNPALENNEFKGVFFIEFFVYFTIEVLFGPISWIIYNFIPKGKIIACNLKILTPGGCYPFTKLLLYIFRCIAVFVTFWMETTWAEFYLLCFTEVSLMILFSTYYSTFYHSEIIKYKTIPNSNKGENDMAQIFMNLIESSVKRLTNPEKLKEEFPEIDFNMYYFYFRTDKQPRINMNINFDNESTSLSPIAIESNNINEYAMITKYDDTVVIDGIALTAYITKLCDNEQNFSRKSKYTKIISRALVFIQFVAPLVTDLITLNVTFEHFNDLNYLFYAITMLSFAILIFRSCLIYDTIFLGLLSYVFKLRLLNFLHNILKQEYNTTFYINLLIPENITNWYNMRKILTRLNQQFYSIVDIILSYILLYILLACIYILITVFLGINFNAVDDLFSDKSFKIITDSYKLVIIVVLYYGLKIGYQINGYFDFDRAILTKNKDIINNMVSYSEFYLNNLKQLQSKKNGYKNNNNNQTIFQNDRYFEYLIHIFDILYGNNFNNEQFNDLFQQHLNRLQTQIQVIIDQLQFEAEMYPHKLLGIQTNENFVLKLISAVSIIGVSNAKEFLQSNRPYSLIQNTS